MRISVVIPTLNEADSIAATIASVKQQSGLYEVIVVDGGSTDSTVMQIPISENIVVVEAAQRGRALQMNEGAAGATGEVFLFLHADTLLPPSAFETIRSSVAAGGVGGAFRLKFDHPTPLLGFSAWFTRFRFGGICFGDRALFATRDAFVGANGFPNVPIFEDLEFVSKLRARGSFDFLPLSVITSSRRYASKGDWRQQWLNTKLWLRYQMGTSPQALADKYWYPEE